MNNAFILIPMLLAASFSAAQSPVRWSFDAERTSETEAMVTMEATVDKGWHIYALELSRDDGPLPTVIHVVEKDGVKLMGPVREPKSIEVQDPHFAMVVNYHDGVVPFRQDLDLGTDGDTKVEGYVEYMVCNDKTCLPPTQLPFSLVVSSVLMDQPGENDE